MRKTTAMRGIIPLSRKSLDNLVRLIPTRLKKTGISKIDVAIAAIDFVAYAIHEKAIADMRDEFEGQILENSSRLQTLQGSNSARVGVVDPLAAEGSPVFPSVSLNGMEDLPSSVTYTSPIREKAITLNIDGNRNVSFEQTKGGKRLITELLKKGIDYLELSPDERALLTNAFAIGSEMRENVKKLRSVTDISMVDSVLADAASNLIHPGYRKFKHHLFAFQGGVYSPEALFFFAKRKIRELENLNGYHESYTERLRGLESVKEVLQQSKLDVLCTVVDFLQTDPFTVVHEISDFATSNSTTERPSLVSPKSLSEFQAAAYQLSLLNIGFSRALSGPLAKLTGAEQVLETADKFGLRNAVVTEQSRFASTGLNMSDDDDKLSSTVTSSVVTNLVNPPLVLNPFHPSIEELNWKHTTQKVLGGIPVHKHRKLEKAIQSAVDMTNENGEPPLFVSPEVLEKVQSEVSKGDKDGDINGVNASEPVVPVFIDWDQVIMQNSGFIKDGNEIKSDGSRQLFPSREPRSKHTTELDRAHSVLSN
jgi:hypothetical protein